jgi:biotin carboxylase
VLIVGGDMALRERSLAGALRAASGRPVFTVSENREAPGLRYFDGSLFAGIADHEAIITEALRYAARTGARPCAVVPTNDFTVTSSALVAEHFGLAHNSRRTVELCRDKLSMKQAFADAGIPVPRFAGFTSRDELTRLARDFTFPVVIKPRLMAGSYGVLRVDRPEDLAEAYRQSAADVFSLAGQANTREDVFQLEEYIDYPYEVSVEVAHLPGERVVLGVTDKQLGPEPRFIEMGHAVPSVHSSNDKLVGWALRACEALGIEYGVAHFEAKVSADGDVRVIEVGARTGGDAIMDLVEDVYGVNPYELHVASYVGGKPDLPELTPRGIAAVAFLKAPTGKVRAVDRSAEVLRAPDIRFYGITVNPGDTVKPLTSQRDREGFVRFFWPDRPAGGAEPILEHVTRARRIASEIFVVE